MPLRFRILPSPASADPGPAVERLVELPDGASEVRFGRREDLEVALPFAALSSLHARVIRQGAGFVLEDLGSRNGTWLGDAALAPNGRGPLPIGERFRLANIWVIFEGPFTSRSTSPEGTGTLARRMVSDLFAGRQTADVARLTVGDGPEAGRVLRLEEAERPYVVGRDPGCDLALTSGDLSREHASFVRRWEGVFVRDLGSKNGVRVRGQAIDGERRLRDGDVVSLGPLTLVLNDPEDRYLQQMEATGATLPAPTLEARAAAGSLVAGTSSANLSNPSGSRLPLPIEVAPDPGPLQGSDFLPQQYRTRLVVAIAGLVLFGAIGLLLFLLIAS